MDASFLQLLWHSQKKVFGLAIASFLQVLHVSPNFFFLALGQEPQLSAVLVGNKKAILRKSKNAVMPKKSVQKCQKKNLAIFCAYREHCVFVPLLFYFWLRQ